MNVIFVENAVARLQKFLSDHNQKTDFQVLTPDASTREYFRIEWNDQMAIACVYGEAFKASEQSYLDVTALFQAANLPVAEIYAFSETLGVILQEDFGDLILRNYLIKIDETEREQLLGQVISLIAQIQAATQLAFEHNSIASRLRFDEEKLLWELNFFKTHYFETLRQTKLSAASEQQLTGEFSQLAQILADRAEILCHRDFHAANLMLDHNRELRIIDHQDARIGTASYDLVSLLLDRVTVAPDADWLASKKQFFLNEREKLGLEPLNSEAFDVEFDLQTVQRCLKACGTFSFQSAMRGKTYFVPFIEPMLRIARDACFRLKKFPHLQQILSDQIER